MSEIKCVRNRKYGTISIGKNGWTKEVCNVTWNEKYPKLDIREWDTDYKKMSKGLTFSKEEAKKLLAILAQINFEDFDAYNTNPLQKIINVENLPETDMENIETKEELLLIPGTSPEETQEKVNAETT